MSAPITRRSLIKRGAVGGVLLASAGAVTLSRKQTRLVEPQSKLQVLTPLSYSVLCAVADRMIPVAEGFVRPRDIAIVEKIDATLSAMHPANAAEFQQALGLLESPFAGLLFDGRPTPFTQLKPADQDRALIAWRDSRLMVRRSAYQAFHSLVLTSYYGSPETYASVGYPGPPEILR